MLDLLQLSQSQRAFLQEAAETYNQQITSRVASYLQGRGIDQDAANGFLLGEACDPLPGHERFRGMLSIPYLSNAGVLGFKFRCPELHDCKATHGAKYDSPAGQKARLFNVNALQSKSDVIVICEGELSALICTTVVGVPAVGTPGTQWAKEHPHWPRCFADYDRVLVVADHDVSDRGEGPGVVHAKRVASTLQGAQVIYPPAGHDLDSWVQEYGVDAVRKGLGV